MPAAHIGPGNVNKLLDDDRGVALANHRCSQVEMVVVEHDDNVATFTINLSVYRVSNRLVLRWQHSVVASYGLTVMTAINRLSVVPPSRQYGRLRSLPLPPRSSSSGLPPQ